MPKYLLRASYTQAGAQGLIKDGGTKRAEVVRAAAASVGGSAEAPLLGLRGRRLLSASSTCRATPRPPR